MFPAHLAITANTLSSAGGGFWVNALVRSIITALLLVLLVYHGSARAEDIGTGGPMDYCSMINNKTMIFGIAREARCALGTGQLLGISLDKLGLEKLFRREVQLGLGNKAGSIQRAQVNKSISINLNFDRRNVFLGFAFEW